MRLTVGPLPPAVYWRRRALVLGGMLVVIVLLAYSCGESKGSDGNTSNTGATNTAATTAAPAGGDAAGTESDPSPTPSTSASRTPTSPSAAAPDRSLCTDTELRVTPVPAARRLARGATTQITLKIKNTSTRTCRRDVGADQQELYIVEQGGAQKIWSSDECGGPRGTNVLPFKPNLEMAYTATWNGRESTDCKDRPLPPAGTYQLYGRLGTKRSGPVTLTLT
jgi:hypothetical protein